MIIPALLFIIFLIIYSTLIVMLWWHLKEYMTSHDPYSWATKLFFVFIGIFMLISIFLFFTVPWNVLLSSLGDLFYVSTKY
jgi:hypothetical protein